MSRSIDILVLDDGELEDVVRVLDRLGVDYVRMRGRAIVPDRPWPGRLLITTARRTEAMRPREEDSGAGEPASAIAVLDAGAPGEVAKLRERGFDYLVRRPVHPEALRLLIVNCVYAGEERRSEPRVPVGGEIWFSMGLLDRPAVLADLSTGGCRLLTRKPLEPGRRVMLEIPESLGASEPLRLKGRVLRSERGAGGTSAAVRFEGVGADLRGELEWILEERSQGPVSLASGGSDAGECGDAYVRMDPDVDGDAREAGAAPAKRVLVARDIGAAGMRVERISDVELGDRLRLALYLRATGEPFVLSATFVRDDGPDGLLIAFDEPPPAVRLELEMLVRGLPSLEALRDGETAPRVLAELLDD